MTASTPGDATVGLNDIEETAQLLRLFSQRAGISSQFQGWNEISESRKHQWRSIAIFLANDGFVIVPSVQVPSAETIAAIRAVRAFMTAHDALKEASGSSSKWEALIAEMWNARNRITEADLSKIDAFLAGVTDSD